ncbi:MAG: pirin family protein [Ignavibacteria bacterium]|nr:pirin family protein [Ignavibacteria bacterium]
MQKTIQNIFSPPPAHTVGDGFHVHNFFPSGINQGIYRMSPFFLLDYGAPFYFSPTDTPRGVDVHPHRGFETVTIAYKGSVAHHDSAGNSGIIYEGDVQWMTAGSGVLHKEYHEEEFTRNGGIMQMVQLWVNLPAKDKMNPPKYQAINHKDIPTYLCDDGITILEIIAGEYHGTQGIASTFTPMHVWNCKGNAQTNTMITLPAHYNTGIVILDGTVSINGTLAEANHFVLFNNDGSDISFQSDNEFTCLILSGEPINENLMPYGPFLMNTKEEIVQAFDDLRSGKFGQLS